MALIALCTKPFAQARDTAQREEEEEHTDSTPWKKLRLWECEKSLASSTKMDFMRLLTMLEWEPSRLIESIDRSSWNLTFLVSPIPSTYIGMPSPALGPAVLHWGNDVASLPPHDILRPDLAVWPWHTSSVWRLSGAPKVRCMVHFVRGSMRKKSLMGK